MPDGEIRVRYAIAGAPWILRQGKEAAAQVLQVAAYVLGGTDSAEPGGGRRSAQERDGGQFEPGKLSMGSLKREV